MPALPQYTYIFALGIVFAFADAFNIGANDVANSFSTSVSSRSLTLRQAALIATFCEVTTKRPFSLCLSENGADDGSFLGRCYWDRELWRRYGHKLVCTLFGRGE